MLESNLRFFAHRPSIREGVDLEPERFRVEHSRAGLPVFMDEEGRSIFSRYDPVREAKRWLEAQELKEDDLPVICGFNPWLAELLATRPALFLEKNFSLPRAILDHFPLPDAFEGVELVVDDEGFRLGGALRRLFDPFRHSRIRVLFPPHNRDTGWAARMAESALQIQRETSMNLLSLSYQLPKWILAAVSNLRAFESSRDGMQLENALAGETAIIVAAGPSLEMNVETLRKVGGRAIILCVDTALRRLASAGVLPDAVTAVDTNKANEKDVDGLPPEIFTIPLFADQIASPGIIRAFRGEKVFLRSINYDFDAEGIPTRSFLPIDRFIATISGREDLASWQSGGSVSTNTFSLAHFLGIKKVILVGHDLAFTNGRTHARGVGYEDEAAGGATRFLTAERERQRQLAMAEVVVEAWGGGQVGTSRVMREFLRWYVLSIERGLGRSMDVIDATEGGSLKAGTRRLRLEDALRELPDSARPGMKLKKILADLPRAGGPQAAENRKSLLEIARRIRRDPSGVENILPLARWLALPAWLGGRDLPAPERERLLDQAHREAARFLEAALESPEAL